MQATSSEAQGMVRTETDVAELVRLQETAARLKQAKQAERGNPSSGTGAGNASKANAPQQMKYTPAALSGLDVEVRQETFTCRRCEGGFTLPTLYAMEPNPDDASNPVPRLWGGESAIPPHCPPCVETIREEAAQRVEALARAERMDPENRDYHQRLTKTVGIHHPKLLRATFKEYDKMDPPEIYNAARSFVEGVLSGDMGVRPWRFFTGPTGTGKSFALVCIDRALYAMGHKGKVAFIVAPKFVEDVQAGYSNKTAYSLLESVRSADVVLVDDLGRGRQTEDKASMMNELSGSLVLLRGVGTHTRMASACPSTSGSVDAASLPARTRGASELSGMSLM